MELTTALHVPRNFFANEWNVLDRGTLFPCLGSRARAWMNNHISATKTGGVWKTEDFACRGRVHAGHFVFFAYRPSGENARAAA
jgi:hypothetical protein